MYRGCHHIFTYAKVTFASEIQKEQDNVISSVMYNRGISRTSYWKYKYENGPIMRKFSEIQFRMMWEDLKDFWPPKLVAFAVFQFVFYNLMFYFFYRLNTDFLTNPAWRYVTVVAVIAGLYTSYIPAYIRDRDKGVKYDGRWNEGYLCFIAPFLIFAGVYLLITFYKWSFELTSTHLSIVCFIYLVFSPVIGWVVKYRD